MSVTLESKSVTESVTLGGNPSVTPSRARALPLGGMSRCHGRDKAVTVTRDSRDSDIGLEGQRHGHASHAKPAAFRRKIPAKPSPKSVASVLAALARDTLERHASGDKSVSDAQAKMAAAMLERLAK